MIKGVCFIKEQMKLNRTVSYILFINLLQSNESNSITVISYDVSEMLIILCTYEVSGNGHTAPFIECMNGLT